MTNAGDMLRERVVERVRQSVFGVFADAEHSDFLGCAWKLAADTYVTCYHVVGGGRQGAHGIFRPDQTFKGGVFYLKNGSTQSRARPLQQHFAGGADLAVLQDRGGNSALPLAVSQRRLPGEASVVAVGYAAADVERTGHGRVQRQLLDGKECLASLDCDSGMSGCPTVDERCSVVGIVTGFVGHTQTTTRVLSHERILMMIDELRDNGQL